MIAIVQFNTPDIEDYATIGAAINQRYCSQHGYGYIREVHNNTRLQPYHEKLLMLQRHLDNHDWLLWLDSDACVIDHRQSLSDFTETDADLVTGGHEIGFNLRGERIRVLLGDAEAGINTGVLLLRNCPWSHRFLASWLLLCRLGNAMDCAFHEQGILQWMLIENICDLHSHIGLINPSSRLNRQDDIAAQEADRCDFILHLWGTPNTTRVDVFEAIARGEKPEGLGIHMPGFHVPPDPWPAPTTAGVAQ